MSVIKATVSFNGKNINVTVTSKAAAIEEWVADIMQQYGSSSSSGVRPDVVTFNTLIYGYCKSEKVDKALEMFHDMHLKGTHITPDVFSYNTIIDALCKDKRLQLALQLFKDMQDRGVAPDVFTYNVLLDGLLKNAQIDTAISVRKEIMENNGVAPDIITYNTIINGLCEAGRLDIMVKTNECNLLKCFRVAKTDGHFLVLRTVLW